MDRASCYAAYLGITFYRIALTSRYIALHCIALHYITVHRITSHDIALHNIAFHSIPFHLRRYKELCGGQIAAGPQHCAAPLERLLRVDRGAHAVVNADGDSLPRIVHQCVRERALRSRFARSRAVRSRACCSLGATPSCLVSGWMGNSHYRT